MLIPPRFYAGARVALVAPASSVPEEKLPIALEYVRSLSLEPVPFPSCYEKNRDGNLAASDRQRADDINQAFSDPSIDGIWCIRGGYGSHRILPLLDREMICRNPKWLGGYSDVTALLSYLNQECSVESYHVPMPSTEPFPDEFTLDQLKKALFGGLSGPLCNPKDQLLTALAGGKACGILCGGNLSLVAASLGTPWEIDTRGKILFLEDVGEEPYRIDSMLTQLRNAGKFRDCSGIILGAWTGCVPENPSKSLTLQQIFLQLLQPSGKPILLGLACGHVLPTLSLPMGRICTIDADSCNILLSEETIL